MANGDFSTALEMMRKSNDDFLEFINKLKTFLGGTGAVEITVGGETYTMDSLYDLIHNYKNGKFESIELEDRETGSKVVLTVDSDGTLKVTDGEGNPLPVHCDTLTASTIENCTVSNVVAENCKIYGVNGSVWVSGGSANLKNLEVDKFTANDLDVPYVRAKYLSVDGSLTCNSLMIFGGRKLSFGIPRNMFYRNGAPIDNAYRSIEIDDDNEWVVSPDGARVTPSDCGFKFINQYSESSLNVPNTRKEIASSLKVPSIIKVWGNNPASFKSKPGISQFWTSQQAPDNVRAFVSRNGDAKTFTDAKIVDNAVFSRVIAWPTGFSISDDSNGAGTFYVSSFLSDDIQREIYYQTFQSEWPIYRMMKVSVKNNAVESVSFDYEYDIPAYSCIRFVVSKIILSETSSSEYVVGYYLGV